MIFELRNWRVREEETRWTHIQFGYCLTTSRFLIVLIKYHLWLHLFWFSYSLFISIVCAHIIIKPDTHMREKEKQATKCAKEEGLCCSESVQSGMNCQSEAKKKTIGIMCFDVHACARVCMCSLLRVSFTEICFFWFHRISWKENGEQ